MPSVKNILEDQTFFSQIVDLNTGDLVDDDYTVNGESISPSNCVKLEFNEVLVRVISRTLQQLLNKRGVKDISSLDGSDRDINEIVKTERKKYKDLNKTREFPIEEQNRALQYAYNVVLSKHKPHYMRALQDAIVWGTVQRSLFYRNTSGGYETHVDGLEVNEDYFKFGFDDSELTELERDVLAEDKSIFTPKPLRSEITEQLCAIAYDLRFKYPNFAETHDEYIKKVIAYFVYANEDVDDTNSFRTRLETALS